MRHFRLLLSAMALLLTSAIHAAVGDQFSIDLLTYTVLAEDENNSTGTVSVKGDPTDINGDLVIPQSVTNGSISYAVAEVADNGFKGCTGLTSAILPEGITTIGEYAFSNCSTLLSVTIPSSLTTSKSNAFYYCTKLKKVYISDEIAYSQIEFKNNQSNPTNYAKNLYLNNVLLTDISIPEGITKINNYAFYQCTSISSVTLPKSLTSIGNYAFYGCASLTSLIIPDNVNEIGNSAFRGCKEMLTIQIPANLTAVPNYMLSDCSKLTEIILPEGVTTIGEYAFSTNIKTIYLPSTIKTIGENAFLTSGCSVYMNNLLDWFNIEFKNQRSCPIKNENTKLYIQNKEVDLVNLVVPEGVTTLNNYLFYSCSMIKSVSLPSTIQTINSYAFHYCSFDNLYIFDLNSWLKCDLQKGFLDKATNVFFDNETLTTLIIPDDVFEIKNYTFSDLKSLEEINFNNTTKIGLNSFANCNNLKELFLPAKIENVLSLAFSGCSSLTSVQFNNPNISFGNNVFSGVGTTSSPCLLKAPENYSFTITTTGNYFKWIAGYFYIPAKFGPYIIDGLCYSVLQYDEANNTGTVSVSANSTEIAETVNIPQSFQKDNVEWTVVKIENKAFENCNQITSVHVPETCTAWGNSTFSGCTSLTTATLDCELTTIPNYTFNNCSKLETVNLKDNGKAIKTINRYAFNGCYQLSFSLPENLQKICEYAFNQCKKLNVTLPASLTTIEKYAFSYCDIQQLEIPQNVTLGDGAFIANKNMQKVTFLGNRTNPGGNRLFEECHLTEIQGIDNFTSIPYQYFKACDFASFNIPASCKTIGMQAFENNKMLQTVTITEGVESIDAGAFHNCSALNTITIPNSVTAFGKYEDYVTSGEWTESKAADGVFANCSSLESIVLPNSITYIPEYTFSNCYALKEIVTPEKVKNIRRYAFYNCTGLKHVDLGNVSMICNNAFENNSSLEQITFPETLKSIGYQAFYNCSSIRMIKIPNSVTKIDGEAFMYCNRLTHVTQPSYLSSINPGNTSYPYYILRDCDLVTEYTLNAYVDNIDALTKLNTNTDNIFVMGNTIPIPSNFGIEKISSVNGNGKPINIYVKKSVFDQQYSDGKVGSLKVDYKIPLSMTNAAGAPIEYKTLCRDFDVDLTHTNDNLPEGVEPLRAYVVEDVDGELRLVFLDEIKYIPSRLKANVKDENGNLYQGVDEYVGVLLRGTPGYTYYYEMGEHDYTQGAEGQWLLEEAMEYSGKTFEKNLMAGDANDDFYIYKTVEDDNNNEIVNYGLNNGRFKIYHKDGWLTYNKSYLQLPKDVSAAIEGDTDAEGNANLTFIFDNADGTTDKVSSVEFMKNAENDIFYNPYGQRVNANAKGIVINNGKKFVNK